MYIPPQFKIENRDELVRFMRENLFVTLVSNSTDGIIATHLPVIVSDDPNPLKLIGHMAKANSQWESFQDSGEVLVIFQGPHAYISPSHYNTQENVPTWNFAAVHAYGTPKIISDEIAALDVLASQIEKYEQAYQPQWNALTDEFKNSKVKGIVPFEITVTRLEGKYKLSQNRAHDEQERIAQSLSSEPDSVRASVGEMMKRNLK